MNIIQDLKLQYKIGGIAIQLIIWNIVLFIVPEVIFSLLTLFKININYFDYIALSNKYQVVLFKPWTLISYSFFHNGFFHLLFNMIILNFGAQLFTNFFTQKQLLSVYVLGGFFAGIVYVVCYTFLPLLASENTLLVGASASVMAVLFASASFRPLQEIRLLFIGTIKLWHIAFLYLAIDLIQLPMENTGGHLAHLGGALFGFLYIQFLKNGTDLGKGFNQFLDWIVPFFSTNKPKPFKKVYKSATIKPTQNTKSSIVVKNKQQQQIDEILDKISRSGYDSLSTAEKEFLFKSGKS